MRVDLAAQIGWDFNGFVNRSLLHRSALLYSRNSEAFETAYFINKVDKFFDSFNVSNFTQDKQLHTKASVPESHFKNLIIMLMIIASKYEVHT